MTGLLLCGEKRGWLFLLFVATASISNCGFCAATGDPGFQREQIEFYETRVLPILSENCYNCHSHQADKIKGSFVLDSREGLLKGGETGPAIVPGAPEKSLLLRAVRHEDEDLKMPPKKKLLEDQIAALAEWVKMGAPYSGAISALPPKTRRITNEDRNWWAFRPVREVSVPKVKDSDWARNPIDKFILAKLENAGLKPSPEADKRALARRLWFDVLGLPPGIEEIEHFLADKSPTAYESLVDTVLRNPHYGETWARHWLDLVRYAESDGYKADAFRPNAWRYRDYVIRSLNGDKPYNRFLIEQIAADELWPEDPNALIGVSYLRLWFYEYNQRDIRSHWATILNDITDVTGDAFLGLGMQCARCHDHKFDPILQRDYFRLQGFFAALSPRDDLPLATPAELSAYREKMALWETATEELRAKLAKIEGPAREKIARGVIEKLPKDIQAIMHKPAGERTPYEQQLYDLAYRQVADEGEKLESKLKGSEKEELETLRNQLTNGDAQKPSPLPTPMLVTDIGPVAPPVTIPKDKLQTPIEPGFLTVLDEAPAKIEKVAGAPNSTGRRAAFAKWLAQPDNPLTARVMVNRVWQRHFGRGIVGTPSDFGHLGESPTHPELLDWLTRYFVEHNWSLKELHRLILTSATYRQTALAPESSPRAVEQLDPDNRLLWRQSIHRLENDQIRDAMLWAGGELDLTAGGPSVEPTKPRRTIYTKWLRNSRDPLLDAFDPPDPYTSTPQRNVTTTPMQSLVLLNGPYVLQRAQALAARLQKSDPMEPGAQVNAAYRLVYGREPTEAEKSNSVTFLKEQAARIAKSNFRLTQVNVQRMPGRSGVAANFEPEGSQLRLVVPDNHLMPQYDFTIEAFVLLRSPDKNGALRTIVSRWDGRPNQPGWSLSVAGKQSDVPPQNLVLELIGDTAEDGSGGYEAIPSGLSLELNKPYFVAVSVRLGDTNETGVTFYLKEVADGAPVQTTQAMHKVTAEHQSNLPLIIGARDPDRHQLWDGLIDDVRLSRQALTPRELLLSRTDVNANTVGFWRFEEPDSLKDSSPHGHDIRAEVSPSAHSDPGTAALVDFCHVLLNSNEFLYVD
jgi:hypothetical protein